MSDSLTPPQDRLVPRAAAAMTAGLPKALLIGDSISIGYSEAVVELLREVCTVRRAPENCGDTRRGLQSLGDWLGGERWDVIHFNWGLHDLCCRHPEATVYGNRDKVRGRISVPLDEYRRNLEGLVKRLGDSAGRLVWASTTVVPDGEAGRHPGDEVRYNEVAAEIMERHDIPINDLYTTTAAFEPNAFVAPGDVHFTKDSYLILAKQVAGCIREQLTTPDTRHTR